jgi:predicted Zn-dependent protease with MMP-like domain
MTTEEFERIVEHSFDRLPEKFREAIENLGVVVEPYPDDEIVRKMHLRSKHDLLGLYQGVPLPYRGSWYGMTPTLPDKVSLYQNNIESAASYDSGIEDKIVEVLIHEIGHYFGMTDEDIRAAGY